ncbi:hypothetical protein J7394_08705 [Ruegeria sp. R13_0]|uniref:hypothetical protein n=1 Tax=Ruegeria sp. R13_0 TaxID=2821099 RepID=UPI001ADD45ED|nr:hypothetical protein [Ruegeria sp. R13_0]MBO9434283.1 hypothetical protein [Ruegeria sp. R13_0]
MYEQYDKSLHAPWALNTMESPPQELDEAKLDAAIADMLREEAGQQNVAPMKRPEFPDLVPQEEVRTGSNSKSTGFSANLRQKWAELSGAA